MDWADVEIDNLRAAFARSCENGDVEKALRLASSLQPFWLARARFREGLALFDAAVTDTPGPGVAPAVWVRAVAAPKHPRGVAGGAHQPRIERGQPCLSRGNSTTPSLIATTLNACAVLTSWRPAETSRIYLDEAADLAQASNDRQTLCETRLDQAIAAAIWGDPMSARAAAEECRDLADALGDRSTSWSSRIWLGNALYLLGDLDEAGRVFLPLVEERAATGELFMTFFANVLLGRVRAYQGQPGRRVPAGKRHLRPRPPWADSRKTSRMRCSPRPPWPPASARGQGGL